MSYHSYEITTDEAGSSGQPGRSEYVPLGHPTRVRYISSGQAARNVQYVSSYQPSHNTGASQPREFVRGVDRRDDRSSSPRRGIDRRRSSVRRIDEIADDLPLRTHRDYPDTARNIHNQDRYFEHSSSCRSIGGRFYCYCGHSTVRQVDSIRHATRVHHAPTPYVCPVCRVACPRGLYQYNHHLQLYHPGMVEHAALQYRDDQFVRRDGSYYR
jgi:hypothetical protein